MKIAYLLIPISILFSCKTTTDKMSTSNSGNIEQKASVASDCPDGGECSVQVFKGKKINVLKDGIGATYMEIVDGDNMIVQYTYSKKGPEGTADGDYQEAISFELPTGTNVLSIDNETLKDVNLIYTKSIKMRGEAGLYKINKGKLSLKKSAKSLNFVLDFTVDETSPKVLHIAENIVL